ncbi:unnamed protein product, partial [Linum tenue]
DASAAAPSTPSLPPPPYTCSDSWVTFASNLPAKPRSPVLISGSIFALCDVGSPWRSQWKLFTCTLNNHNNWVCLEKHEWADIFDLIKRPRLVRGDGNKLLMIGGLKSTFSLNPSCSTMLILRLDLEKLEWEEAGNDSGSGNEGEGEVAAWRWIDEVPGGGKFGRRRANSRWGG